jgi:hypothetical protein
MRHRTKISIAKLQKGRSTISITIHKQCTNFGSLNLILCLALQECHFIYEKITGQIIRKGKSRNCSMRDKKGITYHLEGGKNFQLLKL